MKDNKNDKLITFLMVLAVAQLIAIVGILSFTFISGNNRSDVLYCATAICEDSSCTRDGDNVICTSCTSVAALEDGTDWVGTCTFQYVEEDD